MPRRIIFPRKGVAELQHFEPTLPGPREVQVETRYSLMSIGTETTILHQRYDPDTHFARMFSFPQLKTGVLAVGTVVSVGSETSRLAEGDPVFMRMAHGSHQTLPEQDCSLIPAGIDLKQACWCGLAKTAFRAAWAAEPLRGASVLVVGAGPVGQMAIRWLGARGVSELAVADLSPFRLGLGELGGASVIIPGDIGEHLDLVYSMSNGDGPPIIVDTTGNPAALTHAMAAAARFGKLILLGDTGYPSRQRLSSDMMTKGLTVQATHDSHDRDGWTQARVDAEFFRLVSEGRFDLSRLITHEFSPEQCAQAYELAERDRTHVMGILYDWSQGF